MDRSDNQAINRPVDSKTETGIAAISISRPVTTVMAVLAVIILGGVSFFSIPLTLMPDFSYPEITVRTEMAGASPFEIETYITRRLEENLSIINNVTSITSRSTRGSSELVIKFSWGANLDIASLEIREKVHQTPLPDEAEMPQILKFDPNSSPILELALSDTSGDLDFITLKRMAEKEIKRELLQVAGVAMVSVLGGDEEQIDVLLDESRCKGYGIDISKVINVLKNQDIDLVGGQVTEANVNYTIRTRNRIVDYRNIGDVVILKKGSALIRLSEIADIQSVSKRRSKIARLNSRECLNISIYKQGDANIVKVAQDVKKVLPEIMKLLKKRGYNSSDNLKLKIMGDQSEFIKSAIDEVISSGAAGAVIAIMVLFIFLGKLGPTICAGFCIPVSVVASFMLMHLQGITFNMMSLGGLALGVGMLVDNSIVVLENIYRLIDSGMSPVKAAIRGTSSVAGAITASTITNIAVFFPVVFIEGMAGQVFRDLSLTVTYSLIASLLVSLTLIPCSVVFIKKLSSLRPRKILGIVFFIIRSIFWPAIFLSVKVCAFIEVCIKSYRNTLFFIIKRPVVPLFFLIPILAGGFYCLSMLGSTLLPEVSHKDFYVNITLPQGSILSKTSDKVEKIEKTIKTVSGPYIDSMVSAVGYELSSSGPDSLEAENIAQIRVSLKDADKSSMVMESLEKPLKRMAGMTFSMSKPAMIELPMPVEIAVFGDDLETLDRLTAQVFDAISAVNGVANPVISLKKGAPSIVYRVKKSIAAHYGVSVQMIVDTLKQKIKGVNAMELTRGTDRIDVTVRNQGADKRVDAVNDIYLTSSKGKVPISLFLEQKRGVDRALISRTEGSRVNYIKSGIRGRALSEITADIRSKIERIDFKPGYYADIKGMEKDMDQSLNAMKFAAILAVILVYMAMASQFESILNPMIIMFTVPFSVAGAGYFLFITGDTLNLVAAIGAVMLFGIAVNNGIVLVDAALSLEKSGMDCHDAIIDASCTRLRPILMTTMTTIFGLFPLAMQGGPGSELRASMARTVIGGLSLSTVLTLFIIPLAYHFLNYRLKNMFNFFKPIFLVTSEKKVTSGEKVTSGAKK